MGGTGTAKTVTALMFFDSLNVDREMVKKVAFSYATTGGTFQKTIENELDKRGGKMFGPPGSKNMTVFLDDINMPMVNEWGYVKSVFIVHVGCTRYATSSTDNNLKILARITLTVEFIRTCIFIF